MWPQARRSFTQLVCLLPSLTSELGCWTVVSVRSANVVTVISKSAFFSAFDIKEKHL